MGQDTLRCTSQQKNFLGFISSAFSTTPGRAGHYLPFVPDARHPLKRRNMPVISRKLPVVDILTNNDNNLRCLYNRPIFLRLLQVRSKVCIAEPLRIAEAAFLMPGCPVCLFLRFNSHLPGEPGLASVHWSKGWWRWWWQLDSCKAPVKSSPPTNQHPVFLWAGCPSCHQPTVSMHWRENITFHELAYPKSPRGLPTLSLTTNSSWLPWGRVAMPLISPLMPVPQHPINSVKALWGVI